MLRTRLGRIWRGHLVAASVAAACMPAAGEAQRAREPAPPELVLERTIGGDLVDDAYLFDRIAAIAVGPGGSVYVLDGGSRSVKVYDAAGRFVRSFGREGRGPGELVRPIGMTLDSVIRVFDGAQNRAATFSLMGEHRRTARLSAVENLNIAQEFPLRHGFSLAVTLPGYSLGSEVHEDRVVVAVLRPGSAAADTLARFDAGATIWHAAGEALPWGLASSRFGAAGTWAVHGDSLVAVADGRSGQVTIYRSSPGGVRVHRRGTLGVTGRPVTPADLRALEQQLRASRNNLPRRIEFRAPSHWSVATRALFAADGALWVENGQGALPGNFWTWFPPGEASPLRVRLPDGFVLRAVRDGRLYGVARTANDSEVVRVYRWNRS